MASSQHCAVNVCWRARVQYTIHTFRSLQLGLEYVPTRFPKTQQHSILCCGRVTTVCPLHGLVPSQGGLACACVQSGGRFGGTGMAILEAPGSAQQRIRRRGELSAGIMCTGCARTVTTGLHRQCLTGSDRGREGARWLCLSDLPTVPDPAQQRCKTGFFACSARRKCTCGHRTPTAVRIARGTNARLCGRTKRRTACTAGRGQ